MEKIIQADAVSAWRDDTHYNHLLGFDRETWAWQCLRRTINGEMAFSNAATWKLLRARSPLYVMTLRHRPGAYGHVIPLAEIGGLADFAGHVIWYGGRFAAMLSVAARPAATRAADTFDLRALHHPIVVLRHPGGGEHVLIVDGPRCIRIEVRSGTLLGGPVRLDYHIPRDRHVSARILIARRLTALSRLGRFPVTLFPPERRARRWAMALQAWDGRQAGASHREIACIIHGEAVVNDAWLSESDYLRTHIKRLLRTADNLIGGGWRHLLR